MYVYLLHFSRPINPTRPARHYLGSTIDIDERLRQHRKGQGSRLCEVAKERGISFQLAELFIDADYRQLERTFKRRRNHPKLCPICSKQ